MASLRVLGLADLFLQIVEAPKGDKAKGDVLFSEMKR